MLKKIFMGLVVVLVVLAVIIQRQPPNFRVERSATISATPDAVFMQVNDLHKWEDWSPWAKVDPAMKGTYEGPASGVGAVYSWTGNSKVGVGRMTITESHPSDLVRFKLDFENPFKA